VERHQKTGKSEMEKSKSIAGIVGPTLIVMVLSELKLWNPTLYDTQIVPLVYISGVLFFIAGIAIIRSHNVWILGWQTSLTIIGWLAILLGFARMFFPQTYITQFKNDNSALFVEILLILLGIFLTYKAYLPVKK
jgi:glucan phosphoethanolaminetransferase (alkaline phosphatase superfamily)